jgi:cardiolipin synthase A/B
VRPLLLTLSLLLVAPALARASEVTVLMAGEAKDDLAPVLELVEGAKKRVWVLAYTLSDKDLLALLAKKASTPDFDLRVQIDGKQFLKVKSKLAGLGDAVTPIEVAEGGRMHVKLLLIDDETVVAGSKNWSNLGSLTKWNDLVVVKDPKLAAHVAQHFGRVGGFKVKRGRPWRAKDVRLSFNEPGKPGARTREELLRLLKKAKKRILVGMFVLNDLELAKLVWQQHKAKRVQVQVVLDGVQFANLQRRKDRNAKALLGYLEGLGSSLKLCRSKQLHHKFALIDDVVVTGSANWTKAAWEKNHEAVLILRGKPAEEFVEPYLERHAALWKASLSR